MDSRIETYIRQIPALAEAAAGKEMLWINDREKKQYPGSRLKTRQGGWPALRLIWRRFSLRLPAGMA